MTNLEIKVKVSNLEEIKVKIKSTNATHIGSLTQQDTYFIIGVKRLKLREEGDRSYFVFYTRPDLSSSKISKYHIVHVPLLLKQFSKSVFSFLFGENVVVCKVRQLYIYKNTRIHLDKVEGLGTFLELETVFNSKYTEAELELEHLEISTILNLNQYEKIKQSYSDLKLNKLP